MRVLSEQQRRTWGLSLALVALIVAGLSADAVRAARRIGRPVAIEGLIGAPPSKVSLIASRIREGGVFFRI